ncbi:MAG: RNA polymerase sigma factor [Actinomycetota bacterium]
MFAMGLPTVSPPMSIPADPDLHLIARCKAGDQQAFAELVARHRDGVYSFVRHVVGHEADAQDLAQETFVRAYAAIGRFRPSAAFEPWLYTIASNLCRSHFRKLRVRPRGLDLSHAVESVAATLASDPAAATLQRDQERRLRAAIQALPPEQRIIVVLRHLQSHSYQHISEIVGLPVSTVEHRLRAARKVLRAALEEHAQGGNR